MLVPAFYELAKRHDEIELEVFSSFEIYGLRDLDKAFLDQAILALKTRRSELASRLQFQKAYADAMYSWSMRVQQWTPFLHSLLEATDN